MVRFVLLSVAGFLAIGFGALVVIRTDAGDTRYFGGSHSGHGPAEMETSPGETQVFYLEVLEIKVASPPCDDKEFDFKAGGFPINQGEFSFISGGAAAHGTITLRNDGHLVVEGTVDVSPPCTAHVTFNMVSESALQGDYNCSLGKSGPQAAAAAVPQGPGFPGTIQAITVQDVFDFFRHLIFGTDTPTPVPTPSALPSETEDPVDDLGCLLLGDTSPSGVIFGDANCDHMVTPIDALRVLKKIADVPTQDPTPGPDCAPVGHYYPKDQ